MSQPNYYIVSFLTCEDNSGKVWQLNMANTATWFSGTGWYDGSPEPDSLVQTFQTLQSKGGKVLVSFGGDSFSPGNSITPDSVDSLAKAIAYSFLGGTQQPSSSDKYFTGWSKVFSDWHFDGIDLDLEISAYNSAKDVAVWLNLAKSLKKYAPETCLTCAPQSPYLWDQRFNPFGSPFFPNGQYDTCSQVSTPQDGDFLLSTSNVSLFDALLVQFYNQGSDFPSEQTFSNRLCQLVKLVTSSSTNAQKPQIFVGVAAQGEGHNGDTGIYDPSIIGKAILQAIQDAGGTNQSWWFGGIMGWDSPKVTDLVQNIIKITGGQAALYGYQHGDPSWT
jgi:hypothetical protein